MQKESTLTRARAETISYHTQYYTKHKLFENGSWLEIPDAGIPTLINRFAGSPDFRVLDLGAGVGRNAIALAKALPQDSRVTCVELISVATDLLRKYAAEHQVEEKIVVVNEDFETVSFPENQFNLVLGISTLEHCSSQQSIVALIERAQKWTRQGGMHFMNFSTDRTVVDHETGEPIETNVETRLKKDEWLEELARLYTGWEIEFLGSLEPYSEVLIYNDRKVIWSSNELEVRAIKRN
jgi:cyclopropane fatty-acyl-phospholipid synthase-like methyltransferase